MNAWREPLSFDLPRREWLDLIDTARPAPQDIVDPRDANHYDSLKLVVQSGSLRVLMSK